MRLRLLLSFVLVVLVAVTGVVVVARQRNASEVRAYMFMGGMTGESGLVAALQEYYQANGSWQGVESLLASSSHGQGRGMGGMMGQRLRVADEQGRVVADSGAGVGEAQTGGSLSSAERSAAIPLQVGGRTVGYLLPQGGMGAGAGNEVFLLNRLNRAALAAGAAAGGLALLLALLLSYSLLRPVEALTQAARRLSTGDLTQRVAVSGRDELATLGRTFNQMASSLEQAERGRRALTADIAHELRNPLAVQRAHLEALQDGIYPLSAETLQPVLEQNLLLTRLVEDLRILALAESGQLRLERSPTDLAALLQRMIERFTPQAVARQIRLQTSGEALPALSLDPQRVEQILGNLLSNALRHTPEGGQVSLSLEKSGQGARIRVRDSGPGIPEEALPHIFERFYRAGRSRSRSEGGTGLGLAIARQLAEAHGGSLTTANDPQGGAVFTLDLPDNRAKG
jgi:signal transduction histidine kinase